MDKSPASCHGPSLSGPSHGFSRRDFLRSASLAGAVTGVVGCFERPAIRQLWTKPLRPGGGPRIAIVGCGEQGYALMKSISLIEKAEQMPNVCCVVDIDRTRVAMMADWGSQEGHDALKFEDLGEMLEKEARNLDAVLIATPDWIHHEQTIQCMRAGLHVYCETPMSNRVESAREMVKVARETGRMLEIGYQRRSHPRYLALRDGIVAKHQGLGNLSHAYAQWHLSALNSCPLQVRGHKRVEDLARNHGYASYLEMRNWSLFRRYGLGAMRLGVPLVDGFNFVFQSVPRRISALGGVHYWMSDNPRWQYQMPDKVLGNYEYDLPPHLSPDGKARTVTASLQLLTTTNWQDSFECFHGDAASVEISEYYPRNKIQLTYDRKMFSQDEEYLRRLEESGDHFWADRVRNNIHFAKAWEKMLEEGLIYEAKNDRIWRARRPWESPRPWGKPPPQYAKTPREEDEEKRGLN